jgi:hypothetical protein
MTYPTAFRLLCALALSALPTVAAPQGTAPASAASDGAALAKQLFNPIASLISVPLQFNYDDGYPRPRHRRHMGVLKEGHFAFDGLERGVPRDLAKVASQLG